MVLENRTSRVFSALRGSICLSCRAASQSLARPAFLNTTTASGSFSTTARRAADDPYDVSAASTLRSALSAERQSPLGYDRRPVNQGPSFAEMLSSDSNINYKPGEATLMEEPEPHHLHIVSSKHNTHLTLTRPDRNPIISIAAGNIGFRKAGRGSYDAAYQLAAFLLSNIQDRGLLMEIKRLELVFRGFGEGREAVRKAIMGSEGMNIRNRIVRVTDATRLKFGGTRGMARRQAFFKDLGEVYIMGLLYNTGYGVAL
ncbi:putative 37s ribosomal protein s11 protein [Lasiodiplodia theobromae]|uniref:Mitochondrial ribosomal protein n=1 Tax=Lasiodiplodia theobromae TaxID=45133 RepID=UPI0015C2FEF3|nr:Mitochondrial ribosomal protein [Lasiodiplodia theobromae]KAF4534353.1 Mitochondrial ribosomal protein [Lasiodiplodia theobromae]KAF9640083.1 putative 37s ribosomal protein s11 protein [Lasiodiplodia theobromae]